MTAREVEVPGGDGDDHGWEPGALAPSSSRLSARSRSQRPLDLFHPERLDPVAHLEVVEVLDPNAALESFPHLADVILEPLQAGERTGVDRRAVASDPRLGGPLNGAGPHGAAGDGAHLTHLEELEYLGL